MDEIMRAMNDENQKLLTDAPKSNSDEVREEKGDCILFLVVLVLYSYAL